jgi:exodeoxyribonuclease III
MKLLAWNIRHGGRTDVPLAPAIIAHDPDVIVLGEYRANGSKGLVEHLRFFGWPHVLASAVTGKTNGVALLSKTPIESVPTPLGGPPFDCWGVEGHIAALRVLGVYAPLQGSVGSTPAVQRQFWAGIHRLMETRRDERILVIGDFNTGAAGHDGPNSLPCSTAFERLPSFGWVDAWRASNPGRNDFSYIHRAASGRSNWRIDHAFVSPSVVSAVRGCRYSHIEREQGLSDHSMLIVEID